MPRASRRLEAIRSGEVDAILVSTNAGEKIFTLKGAEEPYRVLFEQMSEGAVMISQDGGILYCNQSFADLMRLPLERVLGTNLDNYVSRSRRQRFHKLLEQSNKGPVRDDMLFEAADGTTLPMQLSVSHLASTDTTTYCVVVADLTERIHLEEALRNANKDLENKVQERTKDLTESEARYRSLFENIEETVTLRQLVLDEKGDVVDSIIVDANPAVLRSWGFSSIGDIRGKSMRELFGPDVTATHLKNVREAMSDGKLLRVEVNFNGRDYLSTFVPLGKDHIIISSADITDIKAAQWETEEYSKKLEQSNAELQQFAYVASHDLQEPLRMVTAYLSLLDRKYKGELDAQAKEYIDHAVDGGARMRRLIDDLLAYSRVGTTAKPPAPVDMKEVVEGTIKMLQTSIDESKADIYIEPMPTITADGPQMLQVMQNLIANAVKFHGHERPMVHISAKEGAKEWIFSIKDNGIGLNVEYADKIFQMFQRLHNQDQYPGTGVGLAITKKIVERHGGRIWVESEEGKGATFYFTIPKSGGGA